jgi:hypothetical protein
VPRSFYSRPEKAMWQFIRRIFFKTITSSNRTHSREAAAPLLTPPPRPLLIHSQRLRSDIGALLVPGLPPEQCTFDQMEREARPAKLVAETLDRSLVPGRRRRR